MKHTNVLLWATALLGTLECANAAPLTTTVTTLVGTIIGIARNMNGILAYKGIPYAAPPVGNLRWKPPQPPVPWQTALPALTYGPSCFASTLQGSPYFSPPSEDCLSLNVWTPALTTTDALPVMVFVPGGGFQFGGSAQPTYDGATLAKSGVVVVTLNYRLNVFGFLALTDLDAEGTNSGDFGLQDQLAALKWVKANIAAFGGDPAKVTFFGESAGAHSVGMLMTSPLATGLFSKAILESGALWDSEAGPVESFAHARARGAAFKQSVGATTVAQLRAKTAVEINAAAQWNINIDPKISAFGPSIDGYVLPVQPGQVFAQGNELKIPLLAGFNTNEQSLFLAYGLSRTDKTKYEAGLQAYFTPRAAQALSLYPDATAAQLDDSARNLIGDMVIREQTYTSLNYQKNATGQPANSVFAYYFTYTSPYSPSAIHTAELAFVFGNLAISPLFLTNDPPLIPLPATAQDTAFSNTIIKYWTNFAKTGNPNGAGLTAWPVYGGNGNNFFQLGNTIQAITYPPARLNFIASFRTNGVLPASWVNIIAQNYQ